MTAPAGVLLRRGLRRRCPICGGRGLFHAWVRMEPACPTCGLVFGRVPGHWLGSWFLNVCLVQAVVLLVLLIGVGATWPDPPMLVIGVGAGVAAIVTPILLFPFTRTTWTAIDLAMRPLDFDDGVAPGFVLADDRAALESERGGVGGLGDDAERSD